MCVYAFVLKSSVLFPRRTIAIQHLNYAKRYTTWMICWKISMGHSMERESEWQKDTHTHASEMFHIPFRNVKKFDCKKWSFCFHFLCFSNIPVQNYAYESETMLRKSDAISCDSKTCIIFFFVLCLSLAPSCDSIIGSSSFRSESVKLVRICFWHTHTLPMKLYSHMEFGVVICISFSPAIRYDFVLNSLSLPDYVSATLLVKFG